MEKSQLLMPLEEAAGENVGDANGEANGSDEPAQEMKPMPFGILGITFLCNLMQYAVYLGLSMLVLMLIRIFGPK